MVSEKGNVVEAACERHVGHELHHLRSSWCWFMALGILLVVCGTAAVVYPVLSSVAAISVLAAVLMIAGIATIIGAFWAGKFSGVLVHLLVGLVYLAAGFVVTEQPALITLLMITIFVAVAFMVIGVFRSLAALLIRFPQWGWVLLNGAVTFLVGLIIYRHLPFSAVWVIGLLVGIELLLNGWTWIMLAMELRSIPKEVGA